MRVISAVLAGALLAVAAAAWAGDDQTQSAGKTEASTPVPPAKTAAAQDPGDQVVCMEYGQGASRIPGRKVCHTRRVWDQLTQNARQDTESLQRSSQFSAPLP